MAKRGKKYQEALNKIDRLKKYELSEAVELAKKYGSADNTAAFVNGVLAKLIKE